jgi:hypothetical protein
LPSIFVAANGSASFTVSGTVNAALLPDWTLNGGSQGSNGELLNTAVRDRLMTRAAQ